MQKSLIMLLVITALSMPAIKYIDSYNEYNSKLLVIEESTDAFNTEFFYKIEC